MKAPRCATGVWLALLGGPLALIAWMISADGGFLPARPRAPVASPPVILVVDERAAVERFREQGDEPPARVTGPLHRLFPDVKVDWRFLGADPSDMSGLRAAIDRAAPSIVVLLNENFVPVLEGREWNTSFLIASELPRREIEIRYADLRLRHRVAFVTWHAGAWGKLIECLEMLGTSRGRGIAAFFDHALVEGGPAADFERVARTRGFAPNSYEYDEWGQFAAAIRSATVNAKAAALVVPIANPLVGRSVEVAHLVEELGILAVYTRSDQVVDEEGRGAGLLSVDAPGFEVYDQIARQIVLILHGARASALETLEPSRLQTTVNLDAARAIGIEIPYEMLVEATEVSGS